MWGKVPCDFLFSDARAMSCVFGGVWELYVLSPPPTSHSLFPLLLLVSLFGFRVVVGEKKRRKSILVCDVSGKRRKIHLWSSWISILENINVGCWSLRSGSVGGRRKNQFLFQMLKQQTWVSSSFDGLFKFRLCSPPLAIPEKRYFVAHLFISYRSQNSQASPNIKLNKQIGQFASFIAYFSFPLY
jgi:hypothetical protein